MVCLVSICRTHLRRQLSLCSTRGHFSVESFLILVDLAVSEGNLVQLSYIRDKEIKKIRFPGNSYKHHKFSYRETGLFCCLFLSFLMDLTVMVLQRQVDHEREKAVRVLRIINANIQESETPISLVLRIAYKWSLLTQLGTFLSIYHVRIPT